MNEKTKQPLSVTPPWTRMIAVCTNCEDGDHRLADHLKSYAKEHDVKGLRVVRSSCLKVCPEKGVTCVVTDKQGYDAYVVPAKIAPEAFFAFIESEG